VFPAGLIIFSSKRRKNGATGNKGDFEENVRENVGENVEKNVEGNLKDNFEGNVREAKGIGLDKGKSFG
jgi:hypothetical protein